MRRISRSGTHPGAAWLVALAAGAILLAACGSSTPAASSHRSTTSTSPAPGRHAGTTVPGSATSTTSGAPSTGSSATTTTSTGAPTTTSAPAAQPKFVPIGGSPPLYEPAEFTDTGDGSTYVDGLTWSSWGPGGATGTGTLHEDNCVPNCASGSYGSYPATVTLSGAAQTSSGYLFTSMTIATPPGALGTQTYTIPR